MRFLLRTVQTKFAHFTMAWSCSFLFNVWVLAYGRKNATSESSYCVRHSTEIIVTRGSEGDIFYANTFCFLLVHDILMINKIYLEYFRGQRSISQFERGICITKHTSSFGAV
jgi:hypothetical protein